MIQRKNQEKIYKERSKRGELDLKRDMEEKGSSKQRSGREKELQRERKNFTERSKRLNKIQRETLESRSFKNRKSIT